MASNLAGKEPSVKKILIEYNGIKKVYCIEDEVIDIVTLVRRAFPSLSITSDVVFLQRYDPEWEELVDIEISQIKDRDKIKANIVENSRESSSTNTSTTSSNASYGVNQLIDNLRTQKGALDYKLSIAQATLESLREIPRPRNSVAGRNPHFTCSNCHLKGHRVNNCVQPSCRGFYECGQLSLHKEHRDQIKQAEAEVREVQKQLKANKDEMENYQLLMERTKTNFFSQMRKKLQCCNLIKYSNRTKLDNDLRILAAACKHNIPSDTANLEKMIEDYQNKAKAMETQQIDVSDISMLNGYHVHQNMMGNYGKMPINIHKPYVPFTINNASTIPGNQIQPPYTCHETSSPLFQSQQPYINQQPQRTMTSNLENQPPYLHYGRSPPSATRPPYVNRTPPGYGHNTPSWQSPIHSPSNVNFRWQGTSFRSQREIPLKQKSPSYYSPYERGYHHGTPPGQQYNSPFSHSFRGGSYRKRHRYAASRSAKDLGKKFKQSLSATTTNNAKCDIGSDDETQDYLTADSPDKNRIQSSKEESQSILLEESQGFNFDEWVEDQKNRSKEIVNDGSSSEKKV